MQRGPRIVGVIALVFATAGCFTITDDFKSHAEDYISSTVADAVETPFTGVSCNEPIDQEVGTRFTCEALDGDGGIWRFENLIDEPGEFTVNVLERP